MVKFIDRTKMTLSGAAGTGNLTFGSAVSGFQGLAEASVVDGDIVRYTIEDGTSYESGTGTIGLSGGTYTMARAPTSSTLANNGAITVGAAGVVIFTMLAQDVVQYLADIANVDDTTPAHGQSLTFVSSTNSWAPVSPSGGITMVANFAAMPTSPSATDLVWTQDTKALYIWDGLEWDRVSTGNQLAPRFTTVPPDVHALSQSGADTVITAVAVDDAGFPITYDWDAFDDLGNVYKTGSLPDMITAISNVAGAFTITPSTNTAHSGNITFRTKASDGVETVVALTTVKLIFTDYVPVPALVRNYANRTEQFASSTGYIHIVSTRNTASYGAVYQGPLKDGKYYTEYKILTGSSFNFAWHGITIGCYDRFLQAVSNTSPSWTYIGTSASGDTHSAFYFNYAGGAMTTSVGNAQSYAFTGLSNGQYPTISGNSTITSITDDIYMIAWDTPNKRVWWGLNGTWTHTSGDPNTAGTGIYLADVGLVGQIGTTSQTESLCLAFLGASGGHTVKAQIYAGEANSLTYSVPTGFGRQ